MPRDKSVQLPSSRRQELQFPPPASAPKTEEDLARERKEQQNAEWNRRKRGVAQAKKEFDRAFMSDERRLKEEEKEAKQQAKEAEKEAKAREKGDAKRMAEEEKRRELLEAKLADAKAAAALQLAREAELRRTLLVEKYTPEGWQLSNKIDKILITFNHPLLPEGDDDLTHLVRAHPINPQYDLFCYNNTAVCVRVCVLQEWRPVITPEPLKAGVWRLDGTNTLVFQTDNPEDDRAWAKATQYTVSVRTHLDDERL
jgi:hypothetical protein